MKLKYQLKDINEAASYLLENSKSKTILFSGEMGAGKTTLIKALASQLGCTDQVSSPTFSLVNEYTAEKASIYHFDFYRIEDETEAYDMGFEDYLYTKHFIFIEWPEKITSLWPQHYTHAELKTQGENLRLLTLSEF